MKAIYIISFLLLLSPILYAQKTVKADTINPNKGNVEKQREVINNRKTKLHSDSLGNQPLNSKLIDTTLQNKYGDLLIDDTAYNKKTAIWKPIAVSYGVLFFTWSVDRFLLQADYAHIGISTWKYNINKGWEWDNDRFGINFIGHPYSGSLCFNAARSNGYNYYESFGFAAWGSLMWEYFGENTRPSYNDIINTSVSGAFIGEVCYRLSSNVLDDRTRGSERVFREIAAGLINPVRGVNRLLDGKTFKTTNKEVYEKEPANLSFYTGIHIIDNGQTTSPGSGTSNLMINAQVDYGNPFEVRSRSPFDFFKLRVDANFGVGRKFVDNLIGSGILYGQNFQLGKLAMLVGAFQYYDYWDNLDFELGAVGFGGGIVTKLPITSKINLYTKADIVYAPLAGNNTRFGGTDTSQYRDYNYGDGMEAKFECMINFGKYADASVVYYYYMIHSYVGPPGNNYVSILKPRITLNIYKWLNIGFEDLIFYDDRYLVNLPPIHSVRNEQKIFLLIYLEDPQRRGQYN